MFKSCFEKFYLQMEVQVETHQTLNIPNSEEKSVGFMHSAQRSLLA